jgi:nicotinic acetylcholine receptor
MCPINVQWFPFDEQWCHMKFGSWSHDEHVLDLRHYDEHMAVNVIDDNSDTQRHNVSLLVDGIGT